MKLLRRSTKTISCRIHCPSHILPGAKMKLLVGNHDAALRDYLTATQLAIDSEVELATYSSYFLRLHEALKNFDREPKSPFEGGNSHYLALEHYSQGFTAFWRGDMPRAFQTSTTQFS